MTKPKNPSRVGCHGQPRIDIAAALAIKLAQAVQATELSFGELCKAYLAAHYSGADMQLKKWIQALGPRSAWDISAQELDVAGQAMIEAGYSPSTVNRNFSQIGSVYRWAKRRRLCPAGYISPTIAQTRYEEPIRRVVLSDAEVARLVDAAGMVKDRRFMVLVRLLVETGARRSEVSLRRWADIDLEGRSIEVLETKTGQPRVLFFSHTTAVLMRRVWPKRDPLVMLFESRRAPGAPVDFKKHWQAITHAIGRQDLRMHDLRHHRAKQLLASGTTAAVASQALGHSSQILQRRYGHLENATMRQAVEASWTT
jgi:integrase